MPGLLDILKAGQYEPNTGLIDPIKKGLLGILQQAEPAFHADTWKKAWREMSGADLTPEQKKAKMRQSLNDPAEAERAMNIAMSINPILHTVYHGSPHLFNKFRMDKIGTGEGAQAYGHGLYFAESPAVADSYKMSTRKPEMLIDGVLYKTDESGMLRNADGKLSGALPSYLDNAARALFGSKHNKSLDILAEEAESFLQTRRGISNKNISAAKQAILDGRIRLQDSGALYKVDIPDEAIPRMLDWDKPLSEQPEGVADALFNAFKNPSLERMRAEKWKRPSWADGDKNASYMDAISAGTKLNALASDLNSYQKASQALKEAGIPGIRYLDGGSRGAGNGTSNFVLFDENMPRILEINGKPTGLMSYLEEALKRKE